MKRRKATNKGLRLLLLIPLLLAFRSSADAQDRTGTSESFKPELLSPYIIEWYIDINEDVDLRQIWRPLGIESQIPYKCDECLAETFDIETGEKSKVVALKISSGNGNSHQYLVFRKTITASTKEEWKFIGNIDSSDQQSRPPAHRIENSEGRVWFILREIWTKQPGRTAYGEVWYEIKENSLKRVLSYPVAGATEPCRKDLGYSYKALVLRHGSENGRYTVPIQLLTSYNISDCEKGKISPALFLREQKAHYVWDGAREEFILDANQSTITEKEIRGLYGVNGATGEEVIEYNFDKFSTIAKGGTIEQKEWLRQFLSGLKDSPRKTALLRAMQP